MFEVGIKQKYDLSGGPGGEVWRSVALENLSIDQASNNFLKEMLKFGEKNVSVKLTLKVISYYSFLSNLLEIFIRGNRYFC